MIKKISLILSILMILCTFGACSGVNEQELLEVLPSLIKDGRELLDIVYGDGLPIDENGPASIKAGYVAVSEDSPYTSVEGLEAALKDVFSEAYTIVLYNTALNGISYDPDTIKPRYIESEDGVLYMDTSFNMNIAKREPKYDSIRIIDSNRFMAEIEITMVYDDLSEESDTFLIVKEDGKWKLDSAVL
ncbi:MAG: hypothetical protein IJ391_09145 [Clostridia bacterium]|nr:hypothetical protein [Clostridia bacterium]